MWLYITTPFVLHVLMNVNTLFFIVIPSQFCLCQHSPDKTDTVEALVDVCVTCIRKNATLVTRYRQVVLAVKIQPSCGSHQHRHSIIIMYRSSRDSLSNFRYKAILFLMVTLVFRKSQVPTVRISPTYFCFNWQCLYKGTACKYVTENKSMKWKHSCLEKTNLYGFTRFVTGCVWRRQYPV